MIDFILGGFGCPPPLYPLSVSVCVFLSFFLDFLGNCPQTSRQIMDKVNERSIAKARIGRILAKLLELESTHCGHEEGMIAAARQRVMLMEAISEELDKAFERGQHNVQEVSRTI